MRIAFDLEIFKRWQWQTFGQNSGGPCAVRVLCRRASPRYSVYDYHRFKRDDRKNKSPMVVHDYGSSDSTTTNEQRVTIDLPE
jgi:hypothetical protein